jgi:hypothetical protein
MIDVFILLCLAIVFAPSNSHVASEMNKSMYDVFGQAYSVQDLRALSLPETHSNHDCYVVSASRAGGFNNRRQVLTLALIVAKYLNCTCAVHPFVQPSHHEHEKFVGTRIRASDLVDFEALRQLGFCVVDADQVEPASLLLANQKNKSDDADLAVVRLGSPVGKIDVAFDDWMRRVDRNADLVMLTAYFGYVSAMFRIDDPVIRDVRNIAAALYVDDVRRRALSIAGELHGKAAQRGGSVVAVHVRLGDRFPQPLYRCGRYNYTMQFVYEIRYRCHDRHGTVVSVARYLRHMIEDDGALKRADVVYLATNKPESPVIAALRALLHDHGIAVFAYGDFDARDANGGGEHSSAVCSAIEQWVCVLANTFVPSVPSSWDELVVDARFALQPVRNYDAYVEYHRHYRMLYTRSASSNESNKNRKHTK